MKMNAGVWIGIIGGVVGLLVGVGSVVATGGPTGGFIGAGMLLVFGGMFYLFYRIFFKPMIISFSICFWDTFCMQTAFISFCLLSP